MLKLFTLLILTAWLPLASAANHTMQVPSELTWTEGPPFLAPGAKMVVLGGDPHKKGLFTLRLKFPANYRVMPHWHSMQENISVIEGELHMGAGPKIDETKDHVLPIGGYAVMPMKFEHYAYTTDKETIVQLHGMGPFDITYVNPTDDPRKKK